MPTTPMCQSNWPSTMTKSVLRIELRAHRADDFLDDCPFNFLPLAISQIQVLRERRRLGQIFGEQQVQGFLGGFQPAGGVQARRELKTDFISAQLLRRLRDFFQRDESGPLRQVQSFQARRKPECGFRR